MMPAPDSRALYATSHSDDPVCTGKFGNQLGPLSVFYDIYTIFCCHQPYDIGVDGIFTMRTGRITGKNISCHRSPECLGNLAAAGIMGTNKGNNGFTFFHMRTTSLCD